MYDGLSTFLVSGRFRFYAQQSLKCEQGKVALRVAEAIPPELAANLDVVYYPQLGATDQTCGYIFTYALRNRLLDIHPIAGGMADPEWVSCD